MKQGLYLIGCLLLLWRCGSDDIVIESCTDPVPIMSTIEQISLDQGYVTSYELDNDNIHLTTDKEIKITLPRECIESINLIDNELLILRHTNGNQLYVGYNTYYEIDYTHNLLGHTPLSGLLTINSAQSGKVSFRIHNKNDNGEDLIKTFPTSSTEHSIPIHGLYLEHNNVITVDYAKDNGETLSFDILQTTIPRPQYLPFIYVDIAQTDQMEPGMNLISHRAKANPTVVFMIDHEGEVRYILDYQNSPQLKDLNFDVGIERLANGNFYFGNWPTPDLYEVDMFGEIINQWSMPGYSFHHNVQEKSDGNFLVTVSKNGSQMRDGKFSVEDYVVEVDRTTSEIIHEWDLKQILDETREVQGRDVWGDVVDWAHNNAVIEDPRDNTIIISCRRQGIMKIDYQDNVRWILNNHFGWGQSGDGRDLTDALLTPVDAVGNPITDTEILEGFDNHPDFEWPWMPHAPFIHPDNGALFCFDNGDRRNYAFDAYYSRAVGFHIDEANQTVQQVYSYGKERRNQTFSSIVSDVDYLPQKDNILFCPGAGVDNGAGAFGGKVVEVDYNTGNVVFEMRLNSGGIVFHRAERMSLYPE